MNDDEGWATYLVSARISPRKIKDPYPLITTEERVAEYLTSDNHWTEIVEVKVERFLDQEVMLEWL